VSERPSATAVRETYFNAVYPSTSNSGVLTAGLHAVEASGYERGRADERRRVLDEIEAFMDNGATGWQNLRAYVARMRQEAGR